MEQRLRDPIIHDRQDAGALSRAPPEFEELIRTSLPPPWDFTDVSMIRNAMKSNDSAVLKALGPPEPELLEERKMITLRDGQQTAAWLIRSSKEPSSNSARPLVVLFHGGGFTLGTADHMIPYARGLVRLFGAVVISATYRLAPEHPFPYGPMDAWDAVEWAARNARSFGANPLSGFIVGGISAGGTFAAVLSQQAKVKKLDPPLTGAWICVPLVGLPEKYKALSLSKEQNAEAPCLSAKEQSYLEAFYAADPRSPWYSPFNYDDALLGLPAAYLQVCGGDPLRDDGLILGQALRDANVKTRLDVYRGMPHGFWAFFPTYQTSKLFMQDLASGFAWLLGKGFNTEKVDSALYLSSV